MFGPGLVLVFASSALGRAAAIALGGSFATHRACAVFRAAGSEAQGERDCDECDDVFHIVLYCFVLFFTGGIHRMPRRLA